MYMLLKFKCIISHRTKGELPYHLTATSIRNYLQFKFIKVKLFRIIVLLTVL